MRTDPKRPECHAWFNWVVRRAKALHPTVTIIGGAFAPLPGSPLDGGQTTAQAFKSLTAALKPMLAEAGRSTGTAFDRDAAVVLRRIETAARDIRAINREDRRAFLDLLGRIIARTAGGPGADAGTDPAGHSSLILP